MRGPLVMKESDMEVGRQRREADKQAKKKKGKKPDEIGIMSQSSSAM